MQGTSTGNGGLRARGERSGGGGGGGTERRAPLYYPEDREYYYGDDRPLSYLSRPRARPEGDWYEPTRYAAASESYYERAPHDVSPEPRARRASSLATLLNREATAHGLTSAHATAAAPSASTERPPKARSRSAPYLTESNRRDIMERIRRGEKQADLAKEYNVSRAAITNLKQRRQMLEMLENSSNAKHREEAQKRRRLSHGTAEPETSALSEDGAADGHHEPPADQTSSLRSEDNDSDESDGAAAASAETAEVRRPPSHREISAQTTSRLLATLLDPAVSDAAFRAGVARHSRLLLEETIGWSFSQAPDKYNPFALAFGGDEAPLLLREYLQMEPASASAALRGAEQRASGDEVEVVARVPAAALRHSPVFVFVGDLVYEDDSTRSTTQQLLFLLQALVFSGLDERSIVVAVLLCDESAARDVARRFPDVHVVTTRFLSENAPSQERSRLTVYRSRRRGASSERQNGE